MDVPSRCNAEHSEGWFNKIVWRCVNPCGHKGWHSCGNRVWNSKGEVRVPNPRKD